MDVWTYGPGPVITIEGGGEQILRMRTATADLWSPVGTFPCAPPILTTIINLKINCLHSEVHVFSSFLQVYMVLVSVVCYLTENHGPALKLSMENI